MNKKFTFVTCGIVLVFSIFLLTGCGKKLTYEDAAIQITNDTSLAEKLKSICNSDSYWKQEKNNYLAYFNTDAEKDRKDICSLDQLKLDKYLNRRNEQRKIIREISKEVKEFDGKLNDLYNYIDDYGLTAILMPNDGGDAELYLAKYTKLKQLVEEKMLDGEFKDSILEEIESMIEDFNKIIRTE